MGTMPLESKPPSPYRTRFAPSPTGPLHFGSLVTAVGSFLRAQSMQGTWVIRIEDIDPPREVPGAAKAQIETLVGFGLRSQGPIVYQSHRREVHDQLIRQLVDGQQAYDCGCSAKEMPTSGIYPGTCRSGLPAGRSPRAVRLKTNAEVIEFQDAVQGTHRQVPSDQTGDFIIRRGDGLIAYQLAVVADDHWQAITEIVRGADLLSSVGRQQLVYRALDYPSPQYMHLPLVVDDSGRKLSKSDGADPVARLPKAQALRLALRSLGHEPPQGAVSLEAMWQWAFNHWHLDAIPRGPVAI